MSGAPAASMTWRACLDVCGALHEGQRHHVHAEREAEPQIVGVFRRQRRGRQRHARRIDALVLAQLAAMDDGRADLVPSVDSTRELDPSVVQQQPSPGFTLVRQRRERRGDLPGPPTSSPVAMRSVSPGCSGIGCPPWSVPVRIFGPARSWRIATDAVARARRAGRIRSNVDAVGVVSPVREIQPEEIDARANRARRAPE